MPPKPSPSPRLGSSQQIPGCTAPAATTQEFGPMALRWPPQSQGHSALGSGAGSASATGAGAGSGSGGGSSGSVSPPSVTANTTRRLAAQATSHGVVSAGTAL